MVEGDYEGFLVSSVEDNFAEQIAAQQTQTHSEHNNLHTNTSKRKATEQDTTHTTDNSHTAPCSATHISGDNPNFSMHGAGHTGIFDMQELPFEFQSEDEGEDEWRFVDETWDGQDFCQQRPGHSQESGTTPSISSTHNTHTTPHNKLG